MGVSQLTGGHPNGLISKRFEKRPIKKMIRRSASGHLSEIPNCLKLIAKSKLCSPNTVNHCHLSANRSKCFSPLVSQGRKHIFPVVNNQLSSAGDVDPCNVEESFASKKENLLSSLTKGVREFPGTPTSLLHSGSVKSELIFLALPAIAGQALDPLAQLMETAYIGRLGPVELASAGVSVSIFNIVSKLFNIPLISVATSFVAEDISRSAKDYASDGDFQGNDNGRPPERKQLPSVSTALLLAVGIGIFEALALYFGSGFFLNMMGVSSASTMHIPARQFLSLRALGAPAAVLSLALQGVFRGFKDTKTPVFCLGVGNFSAFFLFPILMYYLRLGVTGAALATVLSQYIVTFLMIWYLSKKAVILPPKMENLHFGGYIKSGGFLIGRTLAVLLTLTLGTSMAARLGPTSMAAHQICLQVWLAVSLLTDALAASAQALIASSFSRGDYSTVKEVTYFVLKTGLLTGVSLAVVLGASFGSLATVFTKDAEVLEIVRSGILFVSVSQPINALAFIFDGLHYGVSDFSYAAYSMMAVGAISSAFFLYASRFGLLGVWSGLALFMGLRMVAGSIRLLSKSGPWWFLYRDFQKTEVAG